MNIEQALREVLGHLKEAIQEREEKKSEGKVVRTHKPTKSLLAQFSQLHQAGEITKKLVDEAEQNMRKAQEIHSAMMKKHKRLWAEADKEFNIPATTDSRWNDTLKIIEVMDTVNGGHKADCDCEEVQEESSEISNIDELIEALSR